MEKKMQNSHLKLQEIIWEITGRCENRCEYCGSKEAWNVPIDTKKIIKIAKNIAKSPPSEIDISGGDPLLVDMETHEIITNILKDKKVKCKILLNPKSLVNKNVVNSNNILKLGLYDWIGISINTQDELALIQHARFVNFLKKSTIISNFNLQNIFLYNEIEEFVKKNNLMWQIQYTMYKDPNDPLALYNNEKALAFFSSQVSNSLANGLRVLIADNANCGSCGAGLNSIGILYNGDVVPCLSMRSWMDIKDAVVGNILKEDWKENGYVTHEKYETYEENPLKYIWKNRFNKYRFESFECCKDKCKNKCVEIKIVGNKLSEDFDILKKELNKWKKKDEPFVPPRITLYGVCPVPVQVYGVPYPEGTFVYACPGDWKATCPMPSTYQDITTKTSTDGSGEKRDSGK